MTHFCVLVVLEKEDNEDHPPIDLDAIGETMGRLSLAMEPFEETNPGGKWDWFVVGGRWTGEIRLQNNNAPHGWGYDTAMGDRTSGYCDAAEKRQIDIDAMRPLLPYDLLWRGRWHDSTSVPSFLDLWAEIPDEAIIVMVDCHG